MAEAPAPTRASLVADDLVDLARKALEPEVAGGIGGFAISYVYTHDDGTAEDRPIRYSDGRPVVLDYAILELLVEIRDELRTPAEVTIDQAIEVEERRPVLAPRLDEKDLDVLGDRIGGILRSSALVDEGRARRIESAVEVVVTTFLREKGIVR